VVTSSANILAINGNSPADNPLFRVSGTGATSGVQSLVVGSSNQAMVEILDGRDFGVLGTNTTLGTVDGRSVSSGNAYVGLNAGSIGLMTISGTGSRLNAQTQLVVGVEGQGTVNVSDGGRITGTLGLIGAEAGAEGNVVVAGPGSRWDMSGDLSVGLSGTGNLTVTGGGTVTSNTGRLGTGLSGVGNVVVSGTGSVWTVSSAFNIGGNTTTSRGTGTLFVGSGGRIDVATITRIWSTGTVTIGNGGTLATRELAGNLTNHGHLFLGGSGASTSYSEVISGAGNVTKTGSNLLTINSAQTYTGATGVLSGTLRIAPGASIRLGGGLTIAPGAVFDFAAPAGLIGTGTVENNGTFLGDWAPGSNVIIGGSGLFAGTMTIGAGTVVSPGNSPGTQTVTNETWAAGGSYLWEINDVNAGAGVDPGWDLLNITNQLNITATAGGKFNIRLTSLDLSNAAGTVHDFNSMQSYTWTIASAGGITGFNASAFNIDTSDFQNPFSGTFNIVHSSQNLQLTYTAIPEPSSFALAALAAGGAWWRRRRRRMRALTIARSALAP
jgi:T5SS/PEP-CTERM-associated repeat protein/autotransporter-associated beta strand protein